MNAESTRYLFWFVFFRNEYPWILSGVIDASRGLLKVTTRVLHGMGLFIIHHEVPEAQAEWDSPFTILQKIMRSMNAESTRYSFWFVFFSERIPLVSLAGIFDGRKTDSFLSGHDADRRVPTHRRRAFGPRSPVFGHHSPFTIFQKILGGWALHLCPPILLLHLSPGVDQRNRPVEDQRACLRIDRV
jgi:hypothetical protein